METPSFSYFGFQYTIEQVYFGVRFVRGTIGQKKAFVILDDEQNRVSVQERMKLFKYRLLQISLGMNFH